MSNYLKSEKVLMVFPHSAERIAGVTNGRLLNEHNIRNIIKTIVDHNNYVISYDSVTKIFEFVIDGYYFKCDMTESEFVDTTTNLYVSLQYRTDDNDILFGDNDGPEGSTYDELFGGLYFTTSAPQSSYLQLFDTSGNVPETSYKKFIPRSFDIDVIQCKI